MIPTFPGLEVEIYFDFWLFKLIDNQCFEKFLGEINFALQTCETAKSVNDATFFQKCVTAAMPKSTFFAIKI